MEHDDVLDDLLSWTGDSNSSSGPSLKPRGRASLQEGCVNTSSGTTASKTIAIDTTMAHSGTQLIPQDAWGESGEASCCCRASSSSKSRGATIGGRACACPVHDLATPTTSAVAAKAEDFVLPADVTQRLLPHQRDGVQWLYWRHCKSRACLLADEMGLGKTVQVAAFLGELYRRKAIKTTILIVPPTLVPMWAGALVEWGGAEMQKLVEVVHNDQRKKRQARWRKLKYGLPTVLLTTYGVLRQDVAEMSAVLVDYVVLDEAHLIKDASTCAFKSALTLSARHKIALSGTPLMNSFDDMWSVFRFLDGSILSMSKADFNAVSTTLLRGNEKDASADQRGTAQAELSKLQAAIRPFLLRREKKDLTKAVTSTKQDLVVWVRLSGVQQQQYEAFLESKSAPASTTSTDSATNPLLLLTMLSQICNHPWLNLVDNAFSAAVAQPYVAPLPEMGDVFAGAKLWVALQLLVRCVRQGRKALVFSRSKRLLRLLGCLLADWRVAHVQVDGDTASEQRFAQVQRFNESAEVWVCLLTTQVGGVGLTFTAASAVVLLDPSWNPSADAQAVDRVHRIGQERDVLVFRLVTCGTVEEKVYRNQIFKRMAALQSMSAAVVGGAGGDDDGALDVPGSENVGPQRNGEREEDGAVPSELHRYFTRVQLRSMFEMDDIQHSSTAEQLEALHPNRVDDALRRDLYAIQGVCDVSDNTCVLTERVNADGVAAVDATSEAEGTAPQTPPARTRARSPTPAYPSTELTSASVQPQAASMPSSSSSLSPPPRRRHCADECVVVDEADAWVASGEGCADGNASDALAVQQPRSGLPGATFADDAGTCEAQCAASTVTSFARSSPDTALPLSTLSDMRVPGRPSTLLQGQHQEQPSALSDEHQINFTAFEYDGVYEGDDAGLWLTEAGSVESASLPRDSVGKLEETTKAVSATEIQGCSIAVDAPPREASSWLSLPVAPQQCAMDAHGSIACGQGDAYAEANGGSEGSRENSFSSAEFASCRSSV